MASTATPLAKRHALLQKLCFVTLLGFFVNASPQCSQVNATCLVCTSQCL